MRIHPAAMSLATVLLTACAAPPPPTTFASKPIGMTVRLESAGKQKFSGELIAIDDSSLVIRDEARFARVPAEGIRSIDLIGWEARALGRGAWAKLWNDPARRTQLQLRTRYPPGLTPEIETRLLEAYGATRIETLP